MPLNDLTSRDSVLLAVAEFDSTGQSTFLDRYGFGPAKRYFLEVGGKIYDSKAIAAAAYGYQYPDRGPLKPQDFSGGRQVQAAFKRLGFTVRVLPPPSPSPSSRHT